MMSETSWSPMSGNAYNRRLVGQSAACFGLRHAPRFCFRTSAAASSKVGTPCWRRLAASGSPPERASLRLASACSRASASDTSE